MGVELLALRPIFKGEEAKMDKKNVPFQRKQTQKVIEILGSPTLERWPSLPEYQAFLGTQVVHSKFREMVPYKWGQ